MQTYDQRGAPSIVAAVTVVVLAAVAGYAFAAGQTFGAGILALVALAAFGVIVRRRHQDAGPRVGRR